MPATNRLLTLSSTLSSVKYKFVPSVRSVVVFVARSALKLVVVYVLGGVPVKLAKSK